jgi:hypothetical protein
MEGRLGRRCHGRRDLERGKEVLLESARVSNAGRELLDVGQFIHVYAAVDQYMPYPAKVREQSR